jgi:hypothetical protein
LVGSHERKALYFNQGLLETLLPMISLDTDSNVLLEIASVVNSYFFDFPRALECFRCYNSSFIAMRDILKRAGTQTLVVDMILRVIKNELLCGLSKPGDFEDSTIIDDLAQCLTSKSRIMTIAQIIASLCSSSSIGGGEQRFRDQVVVNKKKILEILVAQVTVFASTVSEECITNCLEALASVTQDTKPCTSFILS